MFDEITINTRKLIARRAVRRAPCDSRVFDARRREELKKYDCEHRRVLGYCTCRASKESALNVFPFVRLPGALDLLSILLYETLISDEHT